MPCSRSIKKEKLSLHRKLKQVKCQQNKIKLTTSIHRNPV